MAPALSEDLLERILTAENLRKAGRQVKANPGAPGGAGRTGEDFPVFAREPWPRIRPALREETYQPCPVRRTEIPQRPGQGKRRVGMPTVVDRGSQQAMAQGLGLLFAPDFSAASFGLRPGRSAHHAVQQIQRYGKAGAKGAIDLDRAKFFDRVNHDALMARVARKVRDKTVLRLMGKSLRAGVLVGESLQPTVEGVPQGSPLAPLLATVRLDDLDQALARRGQRCARYWEDFLIVVHRQRAGERVKASLPRFLRHPLKLESNETKSTVGPTHACTFRGFTFHGPRLYGSPEACQDFRHRLRKLTGRSWGVARASRISKRNAYLQGWIHYCGLSQYYRPLPELDAWRRRRLRRCLWKQGRYVRTKVRELLK